MAFVCLTRPDDGPAPELVAGLRVELDWMQGELLRQLHNGQMAAAERADEECEKLLQTLRDSHHKATNVHFERVKQLLVGVDNRLQQLEETRALCMDRFDGMDIRFVRFDHVKQLTDGVEKQLQRVDAMENQLLVQIEEVRQMRSQLYDKSMPQHSHNSNDLIVRDTSFSGPQQPYLDSLQPMIVDVDGPDSIPAGQEHDDMINMIVQQQGCASLMQQAHAEALLKVEDQMLQLQGQVSLIKVHVEEGVHAADANIQVAKPGCASLMQQAHSEALLEVREQMLQLQGQVSLIKVHVEEGAHPADARIQVAKPGCASLMQQAHAEALLKVEEQMVQLQGGVGLIEVHVEEGAHPANAIQMSAKEQKSQQVSTTQETRSQQVSFADLEEVCVYEDSSPEIAKTKEENPDELLQNALEEACLYQLRPSAWDAALLIGIKFKFSRSDSGLLILAVAAQATIQAAFCYIVVVLVAESKKALEVKTVSEECAEQAVLFHSYMDRFTGPLLSLLVVMIWTLSVLREFRRIADFSMAVWNVPLSPKGHRTLWHVCAKSGRLTIQSISYARLVAMMLNAMCQLTVACILLLLGAWWLCSTVVLADLLLNTVALQFIMDIDELMFLVLCSGKVKVITSHLEALRLPKTMVMPHRVPLRSMLSLLAWIVFTASMFLFVMLPNFHIMRAGMERSCM